MTNTNRFRLNWLRSAAFTTCLWCGGAESVAWAQGPIYRPVQMQPQMRAQVPVPAVRTTGQILQEVTTRHTFCLLVGERLASSLISTESHDEGPFQDYIMGANIQGNQQTRTRTTLDFVTSESAIRLKMVLNGVTYNQTLSQVRQAAIQSAGSVEFQVSKQMEFDGTQIQTWSPAAFMTIKQQNLGASTPVAPIPLLGPLVNNIVLSAADQRRPQTEHIAAHRITQAVAPQFNSRLDEELVKLNQQLSGNIKNWLVKSQIYPSHMAGMSSEDAAVWGMAFEPEKSASASQAIIQPISRNGRRVRDLPTRQLPPAFTFTAGQSFGGTVEAPTPFSLETAGMSDRLMCLVHESLLEDLATRFELGGQVLSPEVLAKLIPQSGEGGEQPSSLGTVILAKERPLSATFSQGELVLTIRAGFTPVVGPEIPTQEVVVAFQPILSPDSLVLKPTVRSVNPVDAAASGFFSAAGTTLFRTAIEGQLKEVTLPRNQNLPRDIGMDPLVIRLSSVTFQNGWLTLIYDPATPLSTTMGMAPELTLTK